jgi:hypothetical protein
MSRLIASGYVADGYTGSTAHVGLVLDGDEIREVSAHGWYRAGYDVRDDGYHFAGRVTDLDAVATDWLKRRAIPRNFHLVRLNTRGY